MTDVGVALDVDIATEFSANREREASMVASPDSVFGWFFIS